MNPYYSFSEMISNRYQPYTYYSIRGKQCYCPPVYNRKDMSIRQQPGLEYSVADYIRDYGITIENDFFLDLSDKGLTSLEGLQQIEGLENVGILLLSGNNLIKVPEGIFNGLINLQVLDLSNNQITHNTSSPYEYQWEIGLSAMVFRDLLNLQELFISNNNLYDLPLGIFQYSPLASIDVSRNYFSGDKKAFEDTYFSNVEELPFIIFSPQKDKFILPPK